MALGMTPRYSRDRENFQQTQSPGIAQCAVNLSHRVGYTELSYRAEAGITWSSRRTRRSRTARTGKVSREEETAEKKLIPHETLETARIMRNLARNTQGPRTAVLFFREKARAQQGKEKRQEG